MSAAVRQIAEFQGHQRSVPHEGGPEPGTKPEKERASAIVTAQRLHGCVVDQAHRYAERSGEIETDPSFAQMLRIFRDPPFAHRRRKTNGHPVEFPSAHALLKFCD